MLERTNEVKLRSRLTISAPVGIILWPNRPGVTNTPQHFTIYLDLDYFDLEELNECRIISHLLEEFVPYAKPLPSARYNRAGLTFVRVAQINEKSNGEKELTELGAAC